MKTYTLDEVQDALIGKIGTPERDMFEYELQTDLNSNSEKASAETSERRSCVPTLTAEQGKS